MASIKKSKAVEKAQGRLIELIEEISHTTAGQKSMNHIVFLEQFVDRSCILLSAIEAHFNPAPKTDPKPNAE